jgi:hypothetical protein
MNITPRLALFFLCALLSSPAWSQEKAQNELADKSAMELQDSFTRKSTAKEALQLELEELKNHRTYLEKALEKLGSMNAPPKPLEDAARTFQQVYRDFHQALPKNPAEEVPASSSTAFNAASKTLGNVDAEWKNTWNDVVEFPSISSDSKTWLLELYNSDALKSLSHPENALQDMRRQWFNIRSDVNKDHPRLKVKDLEMQLNALPFKGEELASWINEAFGKHHTQTVTHLEDAKERAKDAIRSREDRRDKLEGELKQLGAALDLRDDKQERTDFHLSIAILFMIGALIVLYVATLFARQSTQAVIFQKRTLVEMIGMAFLLLTIIILGTGEKIDKSVLGTLLGTVGGYIFGQQFSAGTENGRRSKRSAKSARSERKKKKKTPATETGASAAGVPATRPQENATDPGANLHNTLVKGGELFKNGKVEDANVTPPPLAAPETSTDMQARPG